MKILSIASIESIVTEIYSCDFCILHETLNFDYGNFEQFGNILHLLYKAEKPSVRLSDRHADISVVSAAIEMGLARNES